MTDLFTLPLAPLQSSVNVLVAETDEIIWLPDIAFVPDQAPPALQELALVPVQLRVVVPPPLPTIVGFAVNARPGEVDDPTVTVADAVAEPAAPVHINVYVRVEVIEPDVWLPDADLEPDHAPDAEQPVAYSEDQLSVVEPPLVTVVGEALSDTVGISDEPDGSASVAV